MGFFEGEMQAVLTCTLPPTRSEKSKTNIKRAKSKDILEIIPCYPKMEEELANMEKDLDLRSRSLGPGPWTYGGCLGPSRLL